MQKILMHLSVSRFKFIVQKKASYLHHTATTIYLCCVPALEDSTGASCVGLAGANIQPFKNYATIFLTDFK